MFSVDGYFVFNSLYMFSSMQTLMCYRSHVTVGGPEILSFGGYFLATEKMAKTGKMD